MIATTPIHEELWVSDLEVALLPLEDCPVDCEGMTQVISFLLKAADIPHQVLSGYAQDRLTQAFVIPHWWIRLPCDRVIDLRLRMWLGNRDRIPHGIFRNDGLKIAYHGEPMFESTIDLEMVLLLTEGQAARIKIPRPNQEDSWSHY